MQSLKKYLLLISFWMPICFFSLLIVYNTLPYFTFKQDFIFITERTILFLKPLYKFSFYIHIFAGMFCIITALLQFSSIILKKRKAIHIWSGRVYVFVVLFIGAPTGLYMSFFAKGGIAEKCLFMFMAISWFYFTAKGLITVFQKNIKQHKMWMIRSYAMTLTAVTFRVYYIILYLMDIELTKNYEVSLWMSVIGNIAIAEYIIFYKLKQHHKPIKQIV